MKKPKAGGGRDSRLVDNGDVQREFERAMADVRPLSKDGRGRVRAAPPQYPLPKKEELKQEAGLPPDNFVAPGVDGREIRRLRRGDYRAEDELDLHGKTVQDAHVLVKQFIQNSRHARFRCVSIVHGRGLNSPQGVSVLKTQVRLSLSAMREVLAYSEAPRAAGGAGAVYVLLRR